MRAFGTGIQPSLFERLASTKEADAELDQSALASSVQAELMRILNTRRNVRPAGAALTVLDYGIADWAALYGHSLDDRRRVARDIRNAITHFEPRLLLADVEVLSDANQQRLLVRLTGSLRCGKRQWPVAFVIEDVADTLEVSHERFD